MIDQVDYHNNKKINYSEFLAATIDIKGFLTDSRLRAVFNQFDTDSSGKITAENIFLAMQKLGKEINRQEIEDMITQHDIVGDGVLNYDEFVAIFFHGDDQPQEDDPFGRDNAPAQNV